MGMGGGTGYGARPLYEDEVFMIAHNPWNCGCHDFWIRKRGEDKPAVHYFLKPGVLSKLADTNLKDLDGALALVDSTATRELRKHGFEALELSLALGDAALEAENYGMVRAR